jgi:hypothetical protein
MSPKTTQSSFLYFGHSPSKDMSVHTVTKKTRKKIKIICVSVCDEKSQQKTNNRYRAKEKKRAKQNTEKKTIKEKSAKR